MIAKRSDLLQEPDGIFVDKDGNPTGTCIWTGEVDDDDDWAEAVRNLTTKDTVKKKNVAIVHKGGPGSGHFGHQGRPGLVGGSSAGGAGEAVQPLQRPVEGDFKPGGVPFYANKLYDHPSKWDVPAWSNQFFTLPFQESVEAHRLLSNEVTDLSNLSEDELVDIYHRQHVLDWSRADYEERGRIKDKIVAEISEESGVDYDTANKIIGQWAHTSNDTDMRALSIQEAAAEEFGIELSDFQKKSIEKFRKPAVLETLNDYKTAHDRMTAIEAQWDELDKEKSEASKSNDERKIRDVLAREDRLIDEMDAAKFDRTHAENKLAWTYDLAVTDSAAYLPLVDRATERKVMRAIYENTQRKLRAAGIEPNDNITLFRGINMKDKSFQLGEHTSWIGNAIESWSSSVAVAKTFGTAVVAMSVPARNIFSTAISGQGCFTEGEFILFGNIPGQQAMVVGTDYQYEDDFEEEQP